MHHDPRKSSDLIVVSAMRDYDGLETLGIVSVGMDSVKDGSLTCSVSKSSTQLLYACLFAVGCCLFGGSVGR